MKRSQWAFIWACVWGATLMSCSAKKAQALNKKQYHQQMRLKTVGEITGIIKDNIDLFKSCYFNSVKRHNRNIKGNLTLVFTLMTDGRVQRAGVGETQLPLSLRACVVEALWSLRFPPPYTGKQMKINQPLTF